MSREQLLAMLRDAVSYLEHYEYCEHRVNWFEGVVCDCGMRELMVRVEDALATERTEPTQ